MDPGLGSGLATGGSARAAAAASVAAADDAHGVRAPDMDPGQGLGLVGTELDA